MLRKILNILPYTTAFAHCDIPCGIYDPHNLQMAAHTVIRMIQLLENVDRTSETKAEHDIVRITHVKEEHSNILESELMTLKNDYFKPEIIEKLNADLDELFKKTLQSATKARIGLDIESAKNTLEFSMQIAELFYKSKGIECHRVKAPYPTGMDIIVQS